MSGKIFPKGAGLDDTLPIGYPPQSICPVDSEKCHGSSTDSVNVLVIHQNFSIFAIISTLVDIAEGVTRVFGRKHVEMCSSDFPGSDMTLLNRGFLWHILFYFYRPLEVTAYTFAWKMNRNTFVWKTNRNFTKTKRDQDGMFSAFVDRVGR